MARKKRVNPFYVVLVLVGIVFVVTACAYGIMTYRDMRFDLTAASADASHPLWELMREHGNLLLIVELGLLGLGTVGAIATDSFWNRDETSGSAEGTGTPS